MQLRRSGVWIIAVVLAFLAGLLARRDADTGLPAALAQTTPLAGARGVFAFTGQLDANRYGLFMLDVDQGTIWCYEIDQVGGTRKLRLVAARSWIYDRYLQDFNCAEPSFRTVQELVAQQRATAGSPVPVGTPGPDADAADEPREPRSRRSHRP